MNGHNSYICPSCGSNQTATYDAVYNSGTRAGSNSCTHYVSQSALAQKTAPPAIPQLGCGSLTLTLLIAGLLSTVSAIVWVKVLRIIGQVNEDDWGVTLFGAFIICMIVAVPGCFVTQLIFIRRRTGDYKQQLQQWQQSILCRRCNYAWLRSQ